MISLSPVNQPWTLQMRRAGESSPVWRRYLALRLVAVSETEFCSSCPPGCFG